MADDNNKTPPVMKIRPPTSASLKKLQALHEKKVAEAMVQPEIGDKLEDGTVYCGVSPDTGTTLYAMPEDAGLTMNFGEAAKYYAEKMNEQHAFGHSDWRVPTESELNVLFENSAKGLLKDTFNASGNKPEGWYWAADEANASFGKCQRFTDGCKTSDRKDCAMSVRLVRG